jgi:hypothetical protein
MKLLGFLLSASVFSITSANNYGIHLQVNGLPALHSHDIHKRQNPVFDQLRVCQGIISERQCNNGLVQQTVDLLEQCNMEPLAQLIADRCRRNLNGDYCNVASTHIVNVNSAATVCALSPRNNCTSECRELLMLLRDELGCCVNLEFNSTLSPVYSPSVFTPELWSSCDIELVTEECTPSTVQLRGTAGERTCTASELIEGAGMITCTQNLVQPIIDSLLDTSGCEPYGQATSEQCGIDEFNQPCYLRSQELTSSFGPVTSNCQSSNQSSCDPQCTNSLQNFARVHGCCINNFFNGSLAGLTNTRYGWLSDQYWSACGITSPGFCETRLNSDSPGGTPTHSTTTLITDNTTSEAATNKFSSLLATITWSSLYFVLFY